MAVTEVVKLLRGLRGTGRLITARFERDRKVNYCEV
jgi:hypothetical protein